jgi:hypothetical protein
MTATAQLEVVTGPTITVATQAFLLSQAKELVRGGMQGDTVVGPPVPGFALMEMLAESLIARGDVQSKGSARGMALRGMDWMILEQVLEHVIVPASPSDEDGKERQVDTDCVVRGRRFDSAFVGADTVLHPDISGTSTG